MYENIFYSESIKVELMKYPVIWIKDVPLVLYIGRSNENLVY
ncbi:hypothetical protein Emtol_2735 [Emticicia oligotrophica DSM 17448]|uniref:GIY-YIG domain-containing protein n=1 Tax=Emticicia oligotrophica (strain DSM 17448 / CIP 109782 / MTCC 6937 / GPTSA100-15) TaxID=929562 RepID=A0ABN4ARG1_EMTOG|nr:hypothetical protein Emtol_2735 [Emticicia oligotrophica DSM 17448]